MLNIFFCIGHCLIFNVAAWIFLNGNGLRKNFDLKQKYPKKFASLQSTVVKKNIFKFSLISYEDLETVYNFYILIWRVVSRNWPQPWLTQISFTVPPIGKILYVNISFDEWIEHHLRWLVRFSHFIRNTTTLSRIFRVFVIPF